MFKWSVLINEFDSYSSRILITVSLRVGEVCSGDMESSKGHCVYLNGPLNISLTTRYFETGFSFEKVYSVHVLIYLYKSASSIAPLIYS